MNTIYGFIRKSPSARLAAFFDARRIDIPVDFDWASEGRGAALVKSLEDLIADLTELQQDNLKAELDHLASLADANGQLSAEQICAPLGIDLEGLEAVQYVLLMLAIDHPQIFEWVAVHASLIRRTGGKNWSTFQLEDDGRPWALHDETARAAFLRDAIAILALPDHRQREADWYSSIRTNPITGEETEIVQATINVEERAESELAFGASKTLERRVVQKVVLSRLRSGL